MKNKYFFLIWIIPSFLLGIVVGKLLNIYYFSVDKNINIMDILSISATIFVAYIISQVFEKNNQNNRTEKDLFLKKIEETYGDILTIQNIISQREASYFTLVTKLTGVRKSFYHLFNLLDEFELVYDTNLKSTILDYISNIKDMVTDTPRADSSTKPDSPIKVENNIIFINESGVNMVEKEIDKLKKKCFRLQLSINKG